MSKSRHVLVIVFLALFVVLSKGIAFAGTLQTVSDTIDNPEPKKAAMHSISFTTGTTIPASGKIVVKFPILSLGDSNSDASPSASTFQLNGLGQEDVKLLDDSTDISSNITVTSTNPEVNTSPTVTLTLDSSTSIASGSKVKIFLGCAGINGSSCEDPSPKILNPTKTKASGSADIWSITLSTQNSASAELDTGRTKIATIENVRVAAQIDPVLIFTISGIKNSENVNFGNTVGCQNTTDTNTGLTSAPTAVGLGNLSSSRINVSAQLLTITTNLSSGYSLLASSSGELASSGHQIASSKTPSTIVRGQTKFGIRPCGLDVSESVWGGNSARLYAWPSSDSPIALTTDTTGPIGDSVERGNGLISLEYAATVSEDVPAGTYKTSVIYIVTTTF